jgi:hypothetical protein
MEDGGLPRSGMSEQEQYQWQIAYYLEDLLELSRRRQAEYASVGFQNMLFTIRSRCSLNSNMKIQAFYFLLTD